MSELAWEAFCVAVGRATTDADVNGEPMMLAVAHAQRVSGLEAEIERLTAENDVLHKTDKWRYENVLRMKAEIERLKEHKAGWEVEGFIDRLTRRDDTNSERLVLEAISHLRAFSRDCDTLREDNRELRAEVERLHRELQMSYPDHCAENDRLRAALREIITTDPATDPPEASSDWYQEWKGLAFRLKGIARRTLEGEPTDAQLARYHGDVDGDAEL